MNKDKIRVAALAALLLVAAIALGIALQNLFTGESGWTRIEVTPGTGLNCSDEVALMYEIDENQAIAERKQLSLLYTRAAEELYWIFNSRYEPGETEAGSVSEEASGEAEAGSVSEEASGMAEAGSVSEKTPRAAEAGAARNLAPEGNGLAVVNHHINEEVTVDPRLYHAFEIMAEYDLRYLYLAPLYAEHEMLVHSQSDAEAALVDPEISEEAAAYRQGVLSFIQDPEAISLLLLGEQRVKLSVSEAYQKFARENGIDAYLDFYWLKNAFIVDAMSEVFREAGFTRGTVESIDGYVSCLGELGEECTMKLHTREGREVRPVDSVSVGGPVQMVSLRDFPLAETEDSRYYVMESGQIRCPYLDPADGRGKAALPELILYSEEETCARLLLIAVPGYIREELDEDLMRTLAEKGITSSWYGNNGKTSGFPG